MMFGSTLRCKTCNQYTPDRCVCVPGTATKPTHWKDDRGLVVTDEFLQSDKSTSDWRAAYYTPCVKLADKIVPLYKCDTCNGNGDNFVEETSCQDCGGSGGYNKPKPIKEST